MAFFRSILSVPLIACSVFAMSGALRTPSVASGSEPQSAVTAPSGSLMIYVSDFDLDVLQRKPTGRTPRRNPPATPGSTSSASAASSKKANSSYSSSGASRSPSSPDDSKEITPADQANALVNTVSESLIRALHEAGYQAQRLPAGTALPKLGLRLRGVFAEADESNRARRLLIGGEPVSPTILLFVGVNNLSRPEQPLYVLADPPYPDPRHGPVITVTSYAPAARFELSREPSDEELNKMSRQIAADLTALLGSNSLSLPQ